MPNTNTIKKDIEDMRWGRKTCIICNHLDIWHTRFCTLKWKYDLGVSPRVFEYASQTNWNAQYNVEDWENDF